jgi:hypothetical protein
MHRFPHAGLHEDTIGYAKEFVRRQGAHDVAELLNGVPAKDE